MISRQCRAIEGNENAEDIADCKGQDYDDIAWEELCDASLEDVRQFPKLYSFLMVTETIGTSTFEIDISADAEQEFDLPQVSAVPPAELGAGAAEVMVAGVFDF